MNHLIRTTTDLQEHRLPKRGGRMSGWLRLSLSAFLIVLTGTSVVTRDAHPGYAQSVAPQSDEFNATTFTAPFQLVCTAGAISPCPDSPGAQTWSLDANGSGQLRIWTQPGTLEHAGTNTSSTARDLVLQPFSASEDWSATTRMTFPAASTTADALGQSAGLLVYQNDDNFLYLGRTFQASGAPQIRFVQESGGQMVATSVGEPQSASATLYLRLVKTANLYAASFSYDGQTFASVHPAPPYPTSAGYTASYASPRVGLFAVGGSRATAGTPLVPADFDWFRVTVPSPTPTTVTSTVTSTPVTPTSTSVPPTATPLPTPTPAPANLTLSATSGKPGSNIIVGGSSFQPGESVTVSTSFPLYNGNTLTITRGTVANSNGALNPVTITIPSNAKQGSVQIRGTGQSSKRTGAATLAVVYRPTLSPTAVVPPGGTVNVSGQGFVANAPVKVSVTTTTPGGTTTRTADATADGAGAFQTSLSLPPSTRPGTYTVTAVDSAGALRATARVTVAVHPTISLSSGTVLPSHEITVTGGGFSANVRVTVRATFPLYGGGSQTATGTATTSATGTFSLRLTVPARAAAGNVQVVAQGQNGQAQKSLTVRQLAPSVSASPAVLVPGSTTVIRGSGYLPGSKIAISIPVTCNGGTAATLTATAMTNSQGAFSVQLRVPGDVDGGSYTVSARGESSGRTVKTTLAVTKLAPSVVISPTTATPGSQATLNGLGFAPGATVTLSMAGHNLGSATADGSGKFSLTITIPQDIASGSQTLTAVSSNGRHATASLTVNRSVARRVYFAALYTVHQEYLALLNPSAIRGRVTITFQLTTGATRVKTLTIEPHSRFTENVNADLGSKVSTAAVVAADVPIVAERIALRGSDGTVVSGVGAPSPNWYFADGNTSHNYVEFIAIQNPSAKAVQVTVHVMPTHHRAFSLYRTVQPTSRLTLKINKFVRDAVGVTVTASAPVVVNRTVRIHHGIVSKIGVTAPKPTWYFAAGPQNGQARHWIAVTNPSGRSVYLTLRAYDSFGTEVGTVKQWLKPNARAGYLMNRIANRTDVALKVAASGPIVAEQMTYVGKNHDASTGTFGTTALTTSWAFAAANTVASQGQADFLNLFNPGSVALPVVVRFMDTAGHVVERTYVVGPLAHQRIDVGSVVPNAQVGIVATSNAPFVALNRYQFNGGKAAGTSHGISESGG